MKNLLKIWLTLLAVEGAVAVTCNANQFVQSNVCINCPTNSESVVGSDALSDCKVKAGFYISTKSFSAGDSAGLVISAAPVNFYALGGASASAQAITAAMYTACPFAGTTSGTGSTALTDCTPDCGNTGTLKTLAQGGTCVCAATNYGKPGNANPFLTFGAATQGCTAAGAFNIPPSGVSTIANTIGFTAHGLSDGDALIYNTGGGVVAAGLSNDQTYFVIDKTGDTLSIATTPGGSAIGITGTGNNAQFFTPAGTGVQAHPSHGVASNTVSTAVPHGFSVGDQVKVYSGGGPKLEDAGTAIADGTTCFVKDAGGTVFRLAATPGGSQLVLTGGNAANYFTYAGVKGFTTAGIAIVTDTITFAAHELSNGDQVTYYHGGGSAAAGLTNGQTYFVRDAATNTFKVSATLGGSAIDITGTGNNAQHFTYVTAGSTTNVAYPGGACPTNTEVTTLATDADGITVLADCKVKGSASTTCNANHYVSALGGDATTAGTCTACPSKSYIAAGSDSTSAGALNRCTSRACAADQYVNAGTCKNCLTGFTRLAGDDSSGANTECTKCADGYYVSAKGAHTSTPGTCTACATGFSTTGAESHSGGTMFNTKELGCLKTAAGYFLKVKAQEQATTANSVVEACPTGYTADSQSATSSGAAMAHARYGCTKTAPGYFLKTKGTADTTTANSVVEACPTGYTADSQSATASGTVALGCLKTAPGYFLKTKGTAAVTTANSVVEACPAGKTNAGGADATSAGTELTAATGCLSVAADYYVSAVGSDASTAGTVSACAYGSTNAAGDSSVGGASGVLTQCDIAANTTSPSPPSVNTTSPSPPSVNTTSPSPPSVNTTSPPPPTPPPPQPPSLILDDDDRAQRLTGLFVVLATALNILFTL